VAEGPVITVPTGDIGYTSQLVIKAPDARPEQTAVVGFFLPTGTIDGQGPRSLYPDALDPRLALTVHRGAMGLGSGDRQNACEVGPTALARVVEQHGAPVLLRLDPAHQVELPDHSTGSIDGPRRFASFDIAHNPFERRLLFSALDAVCGLILSLFAPRRRV